MAFQLVRALREQAELGGLGRGGVAVRRAELGEHGGDAGRDGPCAERAQPLPGEPGHGGRADLGEGAQRLPQRALLGRGRREEPVRRSQAATAP